MQLPKQAADEFPTLVDQLRPMLTMQPQQQSTWTFPEQYSSADFQTAFAANSDILSTGVRTLNRSWFDTFDWRLFQKKRLLTKEENRWVLQDFQGNPLHTVTSRKSQPLHHLFPRSGLRSALKNFCGIRALIEQGQEEICASEIRILNSDRKVVAIVLLSQSRLSGAGSLIPLTASLHGIRGYEKRYSAAALIFANMGGKEEVGPVATLKLVMESQGRSPLDYDSGHNVPLHPLMPGSEAVSRVYRSLLDDIRRNKQGVVEDIDTEFLHDLRVGVRRTRSGLTLIKGILSREHTDHFKEEFRYIGQMSGAARDLDVYLLSEKKYRARLPQRLQEGLDHFFSELSTKRREEQVKLVHFLESERYAQILHNWEKLFAEESTPPAGKNGTVPVMKLANRIIRRRFQRVLRDGRKIHSETPDTELHRLRIQCKKLRYGLEFFASLYEKKRIKQLIARLKKLQNNLGDFNDLSVQQEMLSEYLTVLRPGSRKSKETAASIGGLMTDMAREHREVRSHFEETFAGFTRKKNLDLYHKLFTEAQETPWPS